MEFCSLGMKTPIASCHSDGMVWFFHEVLISLHMIFTSWGQFLYSLKGSPFGPGDEADLMTSLILHSLGGEVSHI